MHTDLRAAIKARDALRASVLRTTLAAIANAEAVDPSQPTSGTGLLADAERRHLPRHEIDEIVARECSELRTAADEMRRLGQLTEADALLSKAAVLDGYMPV